MEPTADNFDAAAEEDDGTCIPSRDKVIGSYTYTRLWTDVVSGDPMMSFGNVQLTEANTAINAFNSNFNGNFFLQGSTTADDLVFENLSTQTSTYSGNGMWLRGDTVDLVLNITYSDQTLPIPQPYTYYCTKTQ